MMLEEMQDAMAVPESRTKPDHGMTWAEFAKKVDKQSPRVPRMQKDCGLSFGELSREERVLGALKDGPLTRTELADKIGVTYNTASNYLRKQVKFGNVYTIGVGVRTELFAAVAQ